MRRFPRFSRPAPAVLLGLGLLGLLLWGQCSFRVNEGGGSSGPPPPDLHLKIGVGMARLDSFSTRGPEHGYATVTLQNRSDQPCRLSSLDCGLHFDKVLVGYVVMRGMHGTLLPARSEHTFIADFTPYPATDYTKGTDFKSLRAAWQQGQLAQHHAQVEVFYSYYPVEGSSLRESNFRIKTVPLGR